MIFTDEIDADGVGEYLPDELFLERNQSQTDKDEAITDRTKDIKIRVVEKVKIPKGISKIEGDLLDEEIDIYGNIVSDDDIVDGKARTPQGKINNNDGGAGTSAGATGNVDSNNVIKKWVEVGSLQTRLFNTGNSENEYKLMLIPERSFSKGYITVKLAGEQNNVNAKINSAYLDSDNNQGLQCLEEKIFLDSFKEKVKISVIFQLEYEDNCSMEVGLYGYSL